MAVRISVALCTFNGEAYLPGQLQSLAGQTRLPDELVVSDDGSTDGTVEILRRFAGSVAFSVSIQVNEKTVGPAKNFERAIAACGGDVIALSDQDDLWVPGKLAVIGEAFEANPDLGVFFSDAEMCSPVGDDLGYRLWNSVGLSTRLLGKIRSGSGFDVILRQNVVTGATLAFAGRFGPLILPIHPLWMHDGWIALLIAPYAAVHAEPQPLIRYRQHAAQTIGAAQRSLVQQYQNARKMDRTVFARQAEMYQAIRDRLEQFSRSGEDLKIVGRALSSEHLRRLGQKVEHCRMRSAIRLRQKSRLIPSLVELLSFRYERFSLGWKSFAQDLFL